MNRSRSSEMERRLLVVAPVGRDAALIQDMLCRDTLCVPCADLDDLAREFERGAGAILVTEEALEHDEQRLAEVIARQPPWSDIPVLLLTRKGADSAAVAQASGTLGNVTLLERPVRVTALASAVRSALRARERQYQTRAHLQEREEANQRKDEFLATLAHELRNPLAPIRNSVHLLRLSGNEPQVVEMMERQIAHIVRLVDDLMEVSRITQGKIQLRKEIVDLGAVIGASVEISRPLIESAKHELAIALPPEPLAVDADPTRLAQVFSNLLTNAAKYTDPGGRITIEARREGERVVVTVADTGVGIPPQSLAKVFEMFAQVHARDRLGQPGLGIGLTLARSLVEMHGGRLTAASEGAGKGSQFTVRLPLSESRRPGMAPEASSSRMRDSQRILVVDDNKDAADSLGALLKMLGAEVRVVHDGQAALDAFDAFHPSVMLLDLGMPGMNGFEVARRIRARPHSGDTALIAVTGWGQEGDRLLTAEAGFDHHLIKPVDLTTMSAVLAAVGE